MYCNKCGAKLPENSNFCYICGNKLTDIEILFKEAQAQEDSKNTKAENTNNKSIEEPAKAAGEVSFKYDEETTLLMDRKSKAPKKQSQQKTKITNKEDQIKNPKEKNKSTLKRFVQYMKEEETYDKSIFEKKPDDSKKEIEDKESAKKDQGPSKIEEKISIKDPKNNKAPSLFQRLSSFLKEEDEDRLLDLSHEDYQKLMKGQGSINKEDLSKALKAGEETDLKIENKDKQILSSVKTVLGPKRNKDEKEIEEVDFDSPLENQAEESLKRIVSKPYTFEDKGQTIRYSKTVIDSLLDKHEKGQLKTEDFDKIGEFLKEAESQEKTPEALPEEKLEDQEYQETKQDQTQDQQKIEDQTKEQILEDKEEEKPEERKAKKPKIKGQKVQTKKDKYKELKAQPKKTKKPITKEENSKAKKNYIKAFFISLADFFKSIGKFFAITKKKDKKTSVDNIDIIMSSPVESSDTMPLILSEEERTILNKEIDRRQGKTKASKALKKSNAKIHGIIRKLLSYGFKVTIPLLALSFGLTIWPISWLIKNQGFLIFFAILKYVILYLTIQAATNAAFKSIGLRLKRSVIHFFVLVQSLIYLLVDSIYIHFTLVEEKTIDTLLNVLSPKMKTMAIFLLLAFLLVLANYKKIKEKEGLGMFVGWYLVISLTITGMALLLELLLATVFFPVLAKFIF
ncbi:MAG: zinc-ribbon domain-containing protein [Bacillota bacterium]|nr:zinc-ribbon domain-containing protein [Bacillota bacterium]